MKTSNMAIISSNEVSVCRSNPYDQMLRHFLHKNKKVSFRLEFKNVQ